MADLDAIIESLREEGRDEEADEVERLRGSTLRQKASRAEQLEKENAELREKLAEIERVPKVEQAFRDYGVDFDALRPAERELLQSVRDELTTEKVAELVEKWQLPLSESGNEEGSEEEPAAAKVAAAAKRGPSSGSASGPKIEPGDVAAWSADRWVAFQDAYPEEAEALKRGETIRGKAAAEFAGKSG